MNRVALKRLTRLTMDDYDLGHLDILDPAPAEIHHHFALRVSPSGWCSPPLPAPLAPA
jgi:hypothetical protein